MVSKERRRAAREFSQRLEQSADLLVSVLEEAGIGGHEPTIDAPLLRSERVPRRVTGLTDLIVIAIAVAAPTSAAILLWHARAHRQVLHEYAGKYVSGSSPG